MPDSKLTDLSALATPTTGTLLYVVDPTDTTDDPAGSSFKITISDLVQPLSLTWTESHIWSKDGAASTPGHRVTGTWYTGGTATTTKPQVLIEPNGTTSTGWSTSGTGLGVNAASGFVGRIIDLQLDGVSKVDYSPQIVGGGGCPGSALTVGSSPTSTYPRFLLFGVFRDNTSGDVGLIACGNSRDPFSGTSSPILVSSYEVRIGSANPYGGAEHEAAGGLILRANTTASSNEAPISTYAAQVTTEPRKIGDARQNLELWVGPGDAAAGTDVAGQDLYLWGGAGRGTGVGGNIVVQISLPGVTGSTANGRTTVLSISGTTGKTTIKDAILTRVVSPPVALTDTATIATDASLSNLFTVTLGGNRTLGNPTNAVDGQRITWAIKQDGTGSRTLAYDTKFRFGTDLTGATLTTTASKTDYLTAIYRAGDDKFDVIGFIKGF